MPDQSVTQAIRALDQDFMKAASAKDAGALVRAFYAAGAVLLPPNHPLVEGVEGIQKFLQGLMDAGLVSLALDTTRVDSSGDLAYGRGRYTLTLAPPGAGQVQDVGKYVVVYRRNAAGQWRAIEDIFNSDAPAATA
jgi:ketosteroid isomerase-like protein